VIVHVPLPFAVITPFEDTVATLLLEEDQLTVVLFAVVGEILIVWSEICFFCCLWIQRFLLFAVMTFDVILCK
jgi:hypothetical protein